ncbi:MAG: hypothetical protein ACOVMP_11385, partial [Chthoniobacterales bacterium]
KLVSLEWDLVCLAYNVKRLHRLGGATSAMRGGRGPGKPRGTEVRKSSTHNPAQTGYVSVFAAFKLIADLFLAPLAELRVRQGHCRPAFQPSLCFLSPTGC